MSKAENPPPEQLFNDIAQFVTESRALLRDGAMMELAGLDERVKILCDAVLQISDQDRMRYASRLKDLLGELKALGDEMVAQRDQIAEEIRAVSSHKKANVAYRVTDASDNFGQRDDDKE
jgi:predicted metal-dependent phosphoesterase TrpH